jgi:hypothetical protein
MMAGLVNGTDGGQHSVVSCGIRLITLAVLNTAAGGKHYGVSKNTLDPDSNGCHQTTTTLAREQHGSVRVARSGHEPQDQVLSRTRAMCALPRDIFSKARNGRAVWDSASDLDELRRTARNCENMAAIVSTWQQLYRMRRPWRAWLQNSVDDIAFLFCLALISASCLVEPILIAAVCFAHLGGLVTCLAKFVTVASRVEAVWMG